MSKKVQPVVETKAPVAPKPQKPVPPVAPVDKPVPPVAPVDKKVPPVAPSVEKPVPPLVPADKPVPPVAPVEKPVPPEAPPAKHHAKKPESPEYVAPLGPPVFDLFNVSPELDPAITARQYQAINKKASNRESINSIVHRINICIDSHSYARR